MQVADWVSALQTLQPFAYGGLVVGAFLQWRRRPEPASAWLIATFGLFFVVLIASRFLPDDPSNPVLAWAGKAQIAILVLFPYCLFRFMASLIRPVTWVRRAAAVITVVVAVGALLLPDLPGGDEPRPLWAEAYIALLLIQWVSLTGLVSVRLWRAGRGRPVVARRRMRTMSAGATGLGLALVIAGELSQAPGAAVVVQLLALGAAPLMLVGFAPPYVLRAAWRREEESALKEARVSLMAATTMSEVAQTLLPHARQLVGASAAVLGDMDGSTVAAEGLTHEEAQVAIESVGDGSPANNNDRDGSLVTIPMSSGRLTIVADQMMPFFGQDEMGRLEELAALADLALTRNQLLESQRTLAAIVESSEDAILANSVDGTILNWNLGAERIYGYTAQEVVGRPISVIVPPGSEDEITAILEKIGRGESIENHETTRRTKDGRIIDVSLTISPVRDSEGRVTGASTIARDVSQRKEIEREREAARFEADRANRAKSEFLSRMSHELRTPLNAILGFAQLLEMDELSEEQSEGTSEIIKAGKHLLDLINEVLDISRIEAGQLHVSLEPVDAVQCAEECISLLMPLANDEGVRLVLDRQDAVGDDAFVTADRQRLKQVLLNLISNGIKYNRQEGEVRISLEVMRSADRLRIDVTDTGHGLSTEQMDRLFAPFERLGAEGAGIEGSGLGLALSRPLVKAMGGTLTVASTVGKGSTFSVELPSTNDSSAGTEVGTGEASGVAPTEVSHTVLYVEDNISNLKLMTRLVARRPSIALLSAMQGSLGVTLAREHLPDLILLDLNLPDMTGADVLVRLLSDPRTAQLPVVVISADATSGQMERLLEAGARDYLTKPLDVSRLLEVIDKFCGQP